MVDKKKIEIKWAPHALLWKKKERQKIKQNIEGCLYRQKRKKEKEEGKKNVNLGKKGKKAKK